MRLVFQHIPRTGGVTLHTWLIRHFRKVCPTRNNRIEPGEKAYDLYSGHYDAENIANIAGPKVVFTFLREPIERAWSRYRYYVALGKFDGSFEEAVEQYPELENGMSRQLGSLDDMIFVGFTETYERDFRRLCGRLDIPEPETIDRMNTIEYLTRKAPKDFPPIDRGIIEKHNRLDIELYEWARASF